MSNCKHSQSCLQDKSPYAFKIVCRSLIVFTIWWGFGALLSSIPRVFTHTVDINPAFNPPWQWEQWTHQHKIGIGWANKKTSVLELPLTCISVLRLSPTIIDFSGVQPTSLHAFKKMSLCGFSLGSSERRKKICCCSIISIRKECSSIIIHKRTSSHNNYIKKLICFACLQFFPLYLKITLLGMEMRIKTISVRCQN